jgi:hypothetical protein
VKIRSSYRMTTAMSHEEYLRVEGFLGGRELDGSADEPLVRYLLTNFALLGTGLAAWTVVVAGLMWMLF